MLPIQPHRAKSVPKENFLRKLHQHAQIVLLGSTQTRSAWQFATTAPTVTIKIKLVRLSASPAKQASTSQPKARRVAPTVLMASFRWATLVGRLSVRNVQMVRFPPLVLPVPRQHLARNVQQVSTRRTGKQELAWIAHLASSLLQLGCWSAPTVRSASIKIKATKTIARPVLQGKSLLVKGKAHAAIAEVGSTLLQARVTARNALA